jgi:hypothetical protein
VASGASNHNRLPSDVASGASKRITFVPFVSFVVKKRRKM